MLGIGAVIGTGIFVLTAVGAERAGPGLMLSFVIAGFVCAFAALAYAEMSAMVPVSGSAYTYSYTVMGEFIAWIVGWNFILEYAVSGAAVAVGWSGYMAGLLQSLGMPMPLALKAGMFAVHGGGINILAAGAVLVVTGLLIVGTRASAAVTSVLVMVKLAALCAFIFIIYPASTGRTSRLSCPSDSDPTRLTAWPRASWRPPRSSSSPTSVLTP